MTTPIREGLKAYGRAVGREAHVLAEHPRLMWQQLHNRLQWAGGTVEERLAPERERRSVVGAPPWFRTRSPFQESEALVRTLEGHGAPVNACAFSPDGRLIVSGGGHTLLLWDGKTGAEVGFLKGYVAEVKACGFSPDGRWIVSVSGDSKALKVWDTESRAQVGVVGGRTGWVQDWVFSPDGRRIVCASTDRSLTVWDAESGLELRSLDGHTGPVSACAFSPDGSRLISASKDNTMRVWNAESNAEILAVEHGDGSLDACAFSPDGRRIIARIDRFPGGRVLGVWDAETGAELGTLGAPGVWAWAFSPDGRRVVACHDKTLTLWDVESGAEIGALSGHAAWVSCCAFSPDGGQVVSASGDGTLKLWEVGEDAELGTRKPGAGSTKTCAFSPDGRRIVTAGEGGPRRMWDTASGEEIPSATPRLESSACAFSPDGSRIVSGDRILDAESGDEVTRFFGHSEPVTACAFSPDGRRVASGSADETVRIWDADGGVEIHTLGVDRMERELAEAVPDLEGPEIPAGPSHTAVVLTCAFSPDGRRVASGAADGLKVWDTENGGEVWSYLTSELGVRACAFSPDGRWIVSAGEDSASPSVWDAGRGPRAAWRGSGSGVDCAFSPDGRWIVTAATDNELQLWNAASGARVATVMLPFRIRSVAMHPSAPLAAFVGDDGNLYRAWLAGVQYGPLIVTAVDFGAGFVVRCPACWVAWPLDESWLGQEIECPGDGCTARLDVNAFVAGAAAEAAA